MTGKTGTRSWGRVLARNLSPRKISGVYVFAFLVLLFGLWVPETFLTNTTATSIAGEQSVTAMLALGVLFPFATGAFDLSVGFVLGTSAVLAPWLMVDRGFDPTTAILLTLGVGVAIGLANGVLVVGFRINSFIATLAMSSLLSGMILAISGNRQIVGLPEGFTDIARSSPLGIPIEFYYMLTIAVVFWYVLERTPPGRRMYSIGGNPEAARLAGVHTGRLTLIAYVLSAVVASAAGLILTAKVGGGSPSIGPPYLLPVYAAVFLGATQFKQGRANVWGTVLAVFLLATGVKGLQLIGAPFYVKDLFNGFALIVAVGVTSFRRRGA